MRRMILLLMLLSTIMIMARRSAPGTENAHARLAPPANGALGQSPPDASHALDRYFSRLPSELKLREDSPQKYMWTCDYFHLDPLGTLLRKERVSAEYTRGLADGKVQWSNVWIAQAKGWDESFPPGEPQKYMEGFTYKLTNPPDMLKAEFFPGFPASELKTKNLVWDTHMMEGFAWNYFDKLKLNQAYRTQPGPEDVPLAGAGTFWNQQIELTWIGLSKRNGKTCALIQYQAFFNKLKVAISGMTRQGRSHYWGELWVSLTDKHLEYATLYEDVLMEVDMPGQSNKMRINPFRRAVLQKKDGNR